MSSALEFDDHCNLQHPVFSLIVQVGTADIAVTGTANAGLTVGKISSLAAVKNPLILLLFFVCQSHIINTKFELMLTRRAKGYDSSCSQIVLIHFQLLRRNLLLKCAPQSKIAKINKTPYFVSLGSFNVIDDNTTKKLVIFCLLYTSPSPRD